MKKNEVTQYLENITLVLLCALFILFPIVFSQKTTDLFLIPKQILLAAVSLVSLLLLGGRMLSDKGIHLRKTPFDMPLLLLAGIFFISTLLSPNRYDALLAFTPLFFAVIIFFTTSNIARSATSLLLLTTSFIMGGVLSASLFLLSFYNQYILSIQSTYAKTIQLPFNTFGSLLDLSVYLALTLFPALYLSMPLLKIKHINGIKPKQITSLIATIIIVFGLVITLYQLVQKPPLLIPHTTGFQTAFAAISQDNQRILQGFLFGSGYGTYSTVFTRFKQAGINTFENLWAIQTISNSSSFALELLATTGVLGFFAFVFLMFRFFKTNRPLKTNSRKNPFFFSLCVVFLASLLLPFTLPLQAGMLFALSLFVAWQGQIDIKHYYDIALHFVTFKQTLIPISSYPVTLSTNEGTFKPTSHYNKREENQQATRFLPVSFFLFILILTGILGYYSIQFALSDITFQKSLTTAPTEGLKIHNDQLKAITQFRWRDGYYRVFSQTNLALANSLASSIPQGETPKPEVQKMLLNFIQQSITAAKAASAVSPFTATNWQNLSGIYRNLIGFGKDAEQFSILANQQAIVLDPNNPQRYVNLGGIYYQLSQWENAQRQFQIAAQLKPDYANAYYNIGHVLEQKGDLKNALAYYQAVKQLIVKDPKSLEKIQEEIKKLQEKIDVLGEQTQQTEILKPATVKNIKPETNQPPLSISTPSAKLPTQKTPVPIPSIASPSAQ